jgi:hypothetical protein
MTTRTEQKESEEIEAQATTKDPIKTPIMVSLIKSQLMRNQLAKMTSQNQANS